MLIASVNLSLASARCGTAVTASPATMSAATSERHLGMIVSPYTCLVWYVVWRQGQMWSIGTLSSREARRHRARIALVPGTYFSITRRYSVPSRRGIKKVGKRSRRYKSWDLTRSYVALVTVLLLPCLNALKGGVWLDMHR